METLKNGLENVKYYADQSYGKCTEMKSAMKKDKKGWLVCLAVLIITVVRSGLTYSFGMFIVKLQSIYNSSMAEQNWIGTLSFCISLSAAPISVSFIRCFGHKGYRIGGLVGTLILSISTMATSFASNLEWLFFTHSLLYGMGSSLIYMASSLVIGEHFSKEHKYHVLATSILLCGYPIGSLIFNPVHAWLIESFTWRTAFRVTSGLILLSGIVCCWNFSPKESSDAVRIAEVEDETNDDFASEEEDIYKRFTFQVFIERPEIILWFLGNMLSYLGFYMPFMNLAHYMQQRNITTKWSSLALIMLSLAECITYITASFLGDYLKDRLVYVNVASSGALAVICIVWPLIDVSYGMILVISLAMGGFLGLNIVYTYAASRETTKLPIDIAWSYTNLWSGIGILIGPFFNGFIYDINNSYSNVFFVVGGIYLLDTCIFGAIPLIQYRREMKQNAKLGATDLENKNYETLQFTAPKQQLPKQSNNSNSNNNLRKTSLANGSGMESAPSMYIQSPVPTTMTTIVKQQEQQTTVSFDKGIKQSNNPFQKVGSEVNQVTNSVGNAGEWQANFDNNIQ